MKYLKMLGLAAVAVAAVMAFVGASTASAETTLCKVTKDPCPAGENYGEGTVVEATSTNTPEEGAENPAIEKPTLTGGSFGTIKCDSTIKGTIATPTTPSGTVEKANLTWTNCVGAEEVNTTTGGTVGIHHDPITGGKEHDGHLTIKNFVVHIKNIVNCYYGGELAGTLTAGAAPVIHITTKVQRINGGAGEESSPFCPKEPVWHATYKVTKPTPLYVTTGL